MTRAAFPRRGRIYYALLDKARPVLVISSDSRNEFAGDVLVIPCSTQLSIAPTHVQLRKGEGGLPARSVLKCEQITNLRKAELRPTPIGPPINATRLADVERCVLRAIGIPIPL